MRISIPMCASYALVLCALLSGLASAQNVATTAVAAPDESARGHPAFELGWDAAPTYRLVWRRPAPSAEDPLAVSDRPLFEGRLGGSLSLDGGHLNGDGGDDGWRGAVRRAHLLTQGRVVMLGATEYKLEFALERDRVYLNDFYLKRRFERWIDSLQIGYFTPPESLANLGSSSGRSLMEVAAPVAAIAPGDRMGISIANLVDRPSLGWSVNLSSVGQIQEIGEASSSVLRATGRLVWRPIWDAAAPETSDLLHVGVSGSFNFSGGGNIQYRSRPESFLAPYLVDTGEIAGDAGTVAGELLVRRGPASLLMESLNAMVQAESGGTLFFYGLYAQLGWVLTGESRSYDLEDAVIGRVTPRAAYAPFQGRWGAWEITGRLSWLDLSDEDVRGGRMLCLAAGPVWTWNDTVRWHAEYVFARTSDRPGPPRAHLLQARVELRF